ncbi:MAG: hypothetical protein Aurels2KO_25280 [Aureliella sp.]
MFHATYKMKSLFFDRGRVLAALTKAERATMSRQGAFVRRRARTDILRRTKKHGRKVRVRDRRGRFEKSQETVSRPGQPPIVRSSDKSATLKNILFSFNPNTHSVFIGPVKLNGKFAGNPSTTIPQLHEHGGTSTVQQWAYANSEVWNLGSPKLYEPGMKRRSVRARYAKRPFMGPALDKEISAGTIAGPWAGAVK